jgi:predicted enzyme related to lactoylglutathione lyase
MSSTRVDPASATAVRGAGTVEMKLEVVLVPVSDADRAKSFYERLGWRLDADLDTGDVRMVQFTPPGSECSVIFGKGITGAAPGSLEGLQLTVADIQTARAALVRRGVHVGQVFHARTECSTTPAPTGGRPARLRTVPTIARLRPSATRTGTAGCSKRSEAGPPDADRLRLNQRRPLQCAMTTKSGPL